MQGDCNAAFSATEEEETLPEVSRYLSARLGAGKFFRAIGPYASFVFKLFT